MTSLTKLTFVAAVLALIGALAAPGPSDTQADADTAADVADAHHQAAALRAELRRQQAANPHLWTPETAARADKAVDVVASGKAAP